MKGTVEIRVVVREIGKRRERGVRLSPSSTILDLLNRLGYNRETVAIRRNGKIVAEEEELSDGDLVEVMTIVTGG